MHTKGQQKHWISNGRFILLIKIQGNQVHIKGNQPRSGNFIENYEPPKHSLCGPDGTSIRTEEKSVELLMEILERFSKDGDLVLDCFAGTASCALACLQLHRKFTGCEKDQICYELAAKRLFREYKVMYERSNFILFT